MPSFTLCMCMQSLTSRNLRLGFSSERSNSPFNFSMVCLSSVMPFCEPCMLWVRASLIVDLTSTPMTTLSKPYEQTTTKPVRKIEAKGRLADSDRTTLAQPSPVTSCMSVSMARGIEPKSSFLSMHSPLCEASPTHSSSSRPGATKPFAAPAQTKRITTRAKARLPRAQSERRKPTTTSHKSLMGNHFSPNFPTRARRKARMTKDRHIHPGSPRKKKMQPEASNTKRSSEARPKFLKWYMPSLNKHSTISVK
mmetsp:Transcript_153709/g.492805  ORF Transcript_153709/g.492805 Transcript_153709/m.492805 type:complete len:252 (+) Transcript_153709:498-1253(+)